MNEEFWDLVDSAIPLLGVLFAINVVLLVLLAGSLLFVTPGSSAYYVSIVSGVFVVASLLGIGFLVRKCRTR